MNMRQIPTRNKQKITLPKRNYVKQIKCFMTNHLPDDYFWWVESISDEFGMIDRRCKRCGAEC